MKSRRAVGEGPIDGILQGKNEHAMKELPTTRATSNISKGDR